ncbi:tetratricopeptide repeat protein [Candidatus Thorarchaeota archaeon]|nr:MAG: tetratricopeptide repeat protein [Candidatus Thorarchaeota archaeon]
MPDKILEAAKIALEEGRPNDAITVLEPLVENDEENVDALVILGMAYVQAEMPEKAVKVLELAEEQVEQHCVVELFLGRALWALGKLVTAEDHLREALRLDPTEPEPWIDLARILFQRCEYRQAMAFLENALERFPEEINLLFLHSLVAYRLGDFTLATKQLSILHQIEPNLMTCISNYAYILLLQRRLHEAVPFVNYANNIDPEDYRSLLLLGELCFQSGEFENAMDCFGKVLDKDPINIEALARLAIISKNLKDEKSFREYLSRAEMELGRDSESWRGLCGTYSHLNMCDEYLYCLKRWIKSDKNAAAPWVVIASEYHRRGELESSQAAWTRVFELRGYVKIRCQECENEIRLPYDDSKGFDFKTERICSKCNTRLVILDSLATN